MFTRFSFAPFSFSPVAFAIFDLIKEIQEEQKNQVYGSGRKLSVPADWKPEPIREPLQEPSDDALIDKVLEKWEAIEAAQAARTAPAPDVGIPITEPEKSVKPLPEKLDTSPKLSELKAKPIASIPAIDDTLALKAEQDRRNAEQIALILALAEVV